MRDLLADLQAFRAQGERVGRAVLTGIAGSAPRPAGAAMIVGERGSMAGSVSGGCIEGQVHEEIRKAIATGVVHDLGHPRAVMWLAEPGGALLPAGADGFGPERLSLLADCQLRVAAGHMPMLASTLAGAIAKQFPDKFPAAAASANETTGAADLPRTH